MRNKILGGGGNMQALFYIQKVNRDTDRTKLVLCGIVKEGTLQKNMTLRIPLNKSLDITVLIETTETVSPEDKRLKVYIKCEDEDEVEFLLALNLADELFVIDDNSIKLFF